MRTLLTKGAIFVGVALIALAGCKKETETQRVLSTYEDDITMITELSVKGMDNMEVYSDDGVMGIFMLDDGIASDFLIDETDLAGTDSLRARIRDHSIIACLRGLSLTESQKTAVHKQLRIYKDCKDKAVTRAKTIYRELQVKYKTKYSRIYNAFINGSITREKFKTLVAELSIEFKKELRSLHLKEKLDENFKTCFRKFLVGLHPVLTERQWNAFVTCCKR